MRHFRAFVVACVAFSLLLVPSTQAVADEFAKSFNGPWVMGKRVHMTSGCWSVAGVGQAKPRLQVNRNGKWVTIALAKMVNDARTCTDDDYPWRANFYFTPKDRGVKDPESRAYWLTVRVFNSSESDRYPVKVYATGKDWNLDWAAGNCYADRYTFEAEPTRVTDCLEVLGEPWKAWVTSTFPGLHGVV